MTTPEIIDIPPTIDIPAETAPASWLGDVHFAAAFLTRLPLPALGIQPTGGLARAMRAFPLIGGAIGLAGGSVFLVATLALPAAVAALLAVLAMVLATGALHEDGLADTADGLGARGGREQRLEVMRDSRTGAFGVLALVFSIGLRAACLAEAPGGLAGLGAMVAAAALSRGLIPAAMQVMPPARADGLGASSGVPDASIAALAAVLGVLLAAAGIGLAVPAAVLAAVLLGGVVVWVARRALGGYTGDVLGAVQQAAELGVLLAAAGSWAMGAGAMGAGT